MKEEKDNLCYGCKRHLSCGIKTDKDKCPCFTCLVKMSCHCMCDERYHYFWGEYRT